MKVWWKIQIFREIFKIKYWNIIEPERYTAMLDLFN